MPNHGKGGAKKLPTALKALKGGRAMERVSDNEPVSDPIDIFGDIPEGLSKKGRKHWPSVARQLEKMGVLTKMDAQALAMYCEQYVVWREALDAVDKHGLIAVNRNTGVISQSPYVQLANHAHDRLFKILVEFGMTPASRARLTVPDKAPKQNRFASIKGGAG